MQISTHVFIVQACSTRVLSAPSGLTLLLSSAFCITSQLSPGLSYQRLGPSIGLNLTAVVCSLHHLSTVSRLS